MNLNINMESKAIIANKDTPTEIITVAVRIDSWAAVFRSVETDVKYSGLFELEVTKIVDLVLIIDICE